MSRVIYSLDNCYEYCKRPVETRPWPLPPVTPINELVRLAKAQGWTSEYEKENKK